MKIDGKTIAEKMLNDLAGQVAELKKRGVTPTMVVIMVGDNPASLSYIKQKQKAATTIGARLLLNQQPTTINKQQLENIIKQYNNDSSVHGIIAQRPLPGTLNDARAVLSGIATHKDIDGFVEHSPFDVPVAAAVMKILNFITNFIRSHPARNSRVRPFQKLQIVVLGRGETAGKPIADLLIKNGHKVTVVHSKTENPDEIIRSADVIISCVGKSNVVRRDNVKKDAILLSVGIWRDNEGKLHGDYDEEEIAEVASFYTPTPGGVGPVNVACLMKNLVLAAQKSH